MPTPAHVPHRAVRPPSTYTDQQSPNYAKPAPVVEDSSLVSESAALESDIVHEGEDFSAQTLRMLTFLEPEV